MASETRKLIVGVMVSVFTVGAPGLAAYAQDGVLEEVVVTATRVEENIQDVPESISTLSGDKLRTINSGGADIRALSNRVPSLQIESSFARAFPRFYIRGLGNTDFDLNSSQPVSLVYDEVVLENPIVKGFPAFDLDRIEVLRGPQGTLFGRNTPAGTVKFESVKPSQETDGYARVSYADDASIDVEGAIGGGLSETVSGRVSFLYQTRDDWIDNENTGAPPDSVSDTGGFDEYAIRGQLLIEPSDQFSALLNLHYRDLDGSPRAFRGNLFRAGSDDIISGFDQDEVFWDGINDQELEHIGASAKLVWTSGPWELTSITGWESVEIDSRADVDGGFGSVFGGVFPTGVGTIPFDAQSQDSMDDHDQITQEFRLLNDSWDNGFWQVGFYYFSEEFDIDTFNFDTFSPGQPVNGQTFQNQETDAWAVFGAIDLDLNESWSLAAGLRYTDEEKDFTANRSITAPGCFPGCPPTLGPLTADPDDEIVDWDAALTYYINDDVSIYGRVAKGSRAPAIQGRLLFGNVVTVGDTEEILSIEGGIKTELLDGSMRLNANAYWFEMDDQQLTAVGGGANFNQLINADTVDGYGYEIDLDWLVTENFFINAGFSYNDTEIDDSSLFVQTCGAPLTPCTVRDPIDMNPMSPTFGLASIDGNSLPFAPEYMANALVQYNFSLANNDELYLQVDTAYRSDVQFFLYESAEFRGEELWEWGGRAGYSWNDGQYELAVFGRNLTDEENIIGAIDFNNLTGMTNEPRRYGIEFIANLR